MWIEFTEDRGSFKKGQRIDKEESAAKVLIETGIAKTCEAPDTEPVDAAKGAIAEVIKTTVAASFAELRKEIEPIKKGFKDINDGGYELGTAKRFTLPAEAKRFAKLQHIKGENAEERAYKFGMWCMANYALNGRISDPERQEYVNRAVRRCKSMGIPITRVQNFEGDTKDLVAVEKTMGSDGAVMTKASNENTNSSSAFLVPEDFENDIIDLREQFGVFRREAKIVPMASDTRTDPRRRMGLTAYPVGEDQAGTQSTKTWDQVRLTARKWMVLTKFSNELNEDAVINLGDDLMGEIAYAFAYTEDVCGFNGTGTNATYGGIQGVTYKLKNLGTIANILGLQVASGSGYATSYGGIVLGDFNGVVGRLPEYADDNNAKWYFSRLFWGSIVQKLAMAAGGNRVAEIQAGARVKEFAGYPVVISQVLPKTPAVSQVVALFGDLKKAASLGTRRGVTISLSDVALNSFEQDEVAIRGTERFDISVHDVGELSTDAGRDTGQGPLAGPIVGLITAAS